MELICLIGLYIIAWAILIMGVFIGKKNPAMRSMGEHGHGTSHPCIEEVKLGVLILIISVAVSIILFSFVAFDGFNLPNYLTVLACVFGIGISFFFLYQIPLENKKKKKGVVKFLGVFS